MEYKKRERIYDGGMVKFEMEGIRTGWCKSDSGVMQKCHMSPLLFNIYVRELGMKVAQCKHGLKYLMVHRDGMIVEKCLAGFLYADDVCLIVSNEHDLQKIFDSISGCIREYSMKVSGKKWKVICIHGVRRRECGFLACYSKGVVEWWF